MGIVRIPTVTSVGGQLKIVSEAEDRRIHIALDHHVKDDKDLKPGEQIGNEFRSEGVINSVGVLDSEFVDMNSYYFILVPPVLITWLD